MNEKDQRQGWKNISRIRPAKSAAARPAAPEQVPEQVITTPSPSSGRERILPVKAPDMRYILYARQPVCLLDGRPFAMLPISDPSLGYKLMDGGFDEKAIRLKPKFITEMQAMRLLFGF